MECHYATKCVQFEPYVLNMTKFRFMLKIFIGDTQLSSIE
jgi:hypothetical protein